MDGCEQKEIGFSYLLILSFKECGLHFFGSFILVLF